MKVYMLKANLDNYKGLIPVDDGFWDEAILNFNGSNSLLPSWKTLELECPEEDAKLITGDFPYFSLVSIPVFSESAALILNELIKDSGEFLSASYAGENYYLFNVTRVLSDIVSEAHSDFRRLSIGRIVKINKIAFIGDKKFPPIFKWSEMPMGNVFVNDLFKRAVEHQSLKGFEFIECDIVPFMPLT